METLRVAGDPVIFKNKDNRFAQQQKQRSGGAGGGKIGYILLKKFIP
jgi:hypothetical protein